MKKLEAIIKPFKLEQVKEALTEHGVEGDDHYGKTRLHSR
jgi:nitrogen regulatory protein PII